MNAQYRFTNRFLFLLACFSVVNLILQIYASYHFGMVFLHMPTKAAYHDVLIYVAKTFWLSSLPICVFFTLTAIAGFFRKRFYLPFFFVLFFWLGGARELKAIIEYWGWTTSFYLSSKLLAWSSLLMLSTAVLATISWAIEYFLWRKKSID